MPLSSRRVQFYSRLCRNAAASPPCKRLQYCSVHLKPHGATHLRARHQCPTYGSIIKDEGLPFESFLSAWSDAGLSTTDQVGSFHRWHRILPAMRYHAPELFGPTLDVAAGGGGIYPAIRTFLPSICPYSVTDCGRDLPSACSLAGDTIPQYAFDCERDRIPLADKSVGTVLFLDVLACSLIPYGRFWR